MSMVASWLAETSKWFLDHHNKRPSTSAGLFSLAACPASGRVSNCCLLQYEPEAQASGLSAQRPNLSLTKSENVAQFAVEPLACALARRACILD